MLHAPGELAVDDHQGRHEEGGDGRQHRIDDGEAADRHDRQDQDRHRQRQGMQRMGGAFDVVVQRREQVAGGAVAVVGEVDAEVVVGQLLPQGHLVARGGHAAEVAAADDPCRSHQRHRQDGGRGRGDGRQAGVAVAQRRHDDMIDDPTDHHGPRHHADGIERGAGESEGERARVGDTRSARPAAPRDVQAPRAHPRPRGQGRPGPSARPRRFAALVQLRCQSRLAPTPAAEPFPLARPARASHTGSPCPPCPFPAVSPPTSPTSASATTPTTSSSWHPSDRARRLRCSPGHASRGRACCCRVATRRPATCGRSW